MKNTLLLIALAFCWSITFLSAQVVLEDFEGGTSDLTWVGADGMYNGVVMNPDSNKVNMSGFAGSYTKDSTKAFSLFIAEVATPLDLSTNNQFFVDVYATEGTRFIAKLEGTGEAIEGNSNIPVANQWRRYRFDFSAASGFTTLTKIIFFFDYENEPGKGTYLIDNLTLGTDPCAGIMPVAGIVDDFACQRTPIRAGFDSLFVVNNPAPDAVNGAGLVGEFRDPPGGFSALVYNYFDDIDITARPVVKLKYWAPIANRLLVKLEGGASPGREIGIDVTDINQWVEYEFDFSAFAGQSFKSLTLFTNAGQDAQGVRYYFDDIRFEEKQQTVLEDFDANTGNFLWRPLGNNTAVHGVFAQITNPDQSGLNTTAMTGSHTKGNAALSILEGLLATPLDLSQESQLNLLVWAPAGSQEVRLTAISATQGRLDVTRDITATGEWIEVQFNLQDFADATDISRLEIIFDPTLTGARTYYFDELRLGGSTVDPCEGTIPAPRIVDDFECQRNAEIISSLDNIASVDNPDFDGNPSAKVGKYTDPNDEFSALVYQFTDPLDFTTFNNVSFDVWSPKLVPLAVKFEDSANGTPNIEKVIQVTSIEEWNNYRVDFGDVANGQFKRLVIFFNFAVLPGTETDVYYIDNISFRRGPVTACVSNFETANTSITDWRGFAGGSTNDTAFAVVANPDISAGNMSATVGRFAEASNGETFAGIFSPLGAPVLFPNPNNQTIRMKVWAPRATMFVMKLENPGGMPGPQTGDVFPTTEYDTPGEWKELTWDFSNFDAAAARWETLTLIPGFGDTPTETTNIYFDDIVIGDANCDAVNSTRSPRASIESLLAYPNPVAGTTFIRMVDNATSIRVIDGLGRTVSFQSFAPSVQGDVVEVDASSFTQGKYYVIASDRDGRVLARTSVIVAH